MKPKAHSLGLVIGVTAGISAVYMIGILADWPAFLVLALLGLTAAATIWMTLRILRDPYSTDKSFDDQFYADRDDLRPVRGP